MVGEPVEHRGGHLGITEDTGPFTEGQVGGDDDRGAFVELADQVEQELAAGLGEGQIWATFTVVVTPSIRTISWLQSNW